MIAFSAVPAYLAIHRMKLSTNEVTAYDGLAIVTPERAIRDGIAVHLGPALIHQAIDHGLRLGRLTAEQAEILRRLQDGQDGSNSSSVVDGSVGDITAPPRAG